MIDYFQYNTHGLLNLIAGFFNLSLGFFALSKNWKSKAHWAFFSFTFTSSVWVFCFGMFSLIQNSDHFAPYLSLSYLLGIPFISPCVYVFCVQWLKLKNKKNRIMFFFALSTLSMIPMTLFPNVVCDIKTFSWGRYPYYRPGFWIDAYFYLLMLAFFLPVSSAFIHLYKSWKSNPSHRIRLLSRNILFAFLIAYLGSTDFLVARGFRFYPFGYAMLSLLILFMSYTMIRFQLLDIKIAIKRFTLIIFIYAILSAFILPAAMAVIGKIDLSNSMNITQTVFTLSLSIGFTLSLGPLLYAYFIRKSYWLKGQMASGFIHELKSPLSTLRNCSDYLTDVLQNNSIRTNGRALEYVRMMEKNVDRLEAQVSDLLQIAKIQDEDISIHKEPSEVSRIIRKVLLSHQALARAKNIQLIYKAANEIKTELDAQKMEQVFSNLISNAIKFSDGGMINIQCESDEREALFTIRDEGRGIGKEHVKNIFDRFYQAHPGVKGSGIGLSIARAWVEAHGGKIWAESEGEGKGTKINFTLPLSYGVEIQPSDMTFDTLSS